MSKTSCPRSRSRFSRAWPLAVVVFLAGGWHFVAVNARYSCDSAAGVWAGLVEAHGSRLRVEAELKAVGVQRYAARAGRLPESLSESQPDMPTEVEFLRWYLADPSLITPPQWPSCRVNLDPTPDALREAREAWKKDKDARALGSQPASVSPVEQDYLGFRILLSAGADARPGAFASAKVWANQPFSPVVQAFLRATDASPPPCSRPFTIRSAFLVTAECAQCFFAEQVRMIAALHWIGLAFLGIVGGLVTAFWKGPPVSWSVVLWGPLVVGAGLAGVRLGAHPTFMPRGWSGCHLGGPIYPVCRAEDREAILRRAVESGDVPPEMAAEVTRILEAMD